MTDHEATLWRIKAERAQREAAQLREILAAEMSSRLRLAKQVEELTSEIRRMKQRIAGVTDL
jgi:hypothetical protein